MRTSQTLAALVGRLHKAGLNDEAEILATEVANVRRIELTLEEICSDAEEQEQLARIADSPASRHSRLRLVMSKPSEFS